MLHKLLPCMSIPMLLTFAVNTMAQDRNYIRLTDKQSIPRVIAAMTVEEKVSIVTGMGLHIEGLPPGILPPGYPADDAVPEKVPGASGRTHAIPRLGIPSLTFTDGPAGVRISPVRHHDTTRTYYATAFPVATLMASSWDTALVTQVGTAMGHEALEYGIDVLLAPGMNIQRNPLGGRNFEYYSEDPVLSGLVSAAMIRGVQSAGVGVSVKHFAANNQEFNRMQMNTHVSERALREIYLRGFQLAVKIAKPWTIMSSYNYINGNYVSQYPGLLKGVLRDEWKFKGIVMTDWYGGKDPAKQMLAYNNLLMPGYAAQSDALLAAVKQGTVPMQVLDENVAGILQLVLQSPTFKKYPYTDKPDLAASAALARKAGAESMVLLKNENALPIAAPGKIALFGVTSYRIIAGGTGSGGVFKAYVTDLDKAMLQGGFVLDAGLQTEYSKYISSQLAQQPKTFSLFGTPPAIPELQLDTETISRLAKYMDAAVITLGRNAGEGADRKIQDFNVRKDELTLIESISRAFHAQQKKVIVILNIDGVIETANWRDMADAILLAWQPGQEGGSCMADVLSGNVNPSGKLAATFPLRYEDVPSADNFPGKEIPGADNTGANPLMGKPSEITYTEDIYVGYRYYSTKNIPVAYPFGHGLSYTIFSYSQARLSSPTYVAPVKVSITVTNSGKKAGKEIVQLYVQPPVIKAGRPVKELKAFAKTKLLQPGEKENLQLGITAQDLAWFDESKSAWIVSPGIYTIQLASSATDVRQTVTLRVNKEIIVEKVKPVLAVK
ncbi:MAG: glycoside hydrolase family 3 C-terminal domain-containing protein [Chitinophaga sp.]|uniref:beta-glucosidase n=1 Tax=Chitinophaga sp. TaxID=1869181 RepID=UPI0025BE247D|nr:glycoside hydrolase family 3 C-terminal domain-containing protein [Chitinophaga sp.]MBV8252719.1 glycoside hydrolase family 3 C-terminal domain-containing protein [Chitinophaga sp.]